MFSDLKIQRWFIEGVLPYRVERRVLMLPRYASLFFIAGIEMDDNELITLEIIHRYVEVLDRYFGNVHPFPFYANDTGMRIGFNIQLS